MDPAIESHVKRSYAGLPVDEALASYRHVDRALNLHGSQLMLVVSSSWHLDQVLPAGEEIRIGVPSANGLVLSPGGRIAIPSDRYAVRSENHYHPLPVRGTDGLLFEENISHCSGSHIGEDLDLAGPPHYRPHRNEGRRDLKLPSLLPIRLEMVFNPDKVRAWFAQRSGLLLYWKMTRLIDMDTSQQPEVAEALEQEAAAQLERLTGNALAAVQEKKELDRAYGSQGKSEPGLRGGVLASGPLNDRIGIALATVGLRESLNQHQGQAIQALTELADIGISFDVVLQRLTCKPGEEHIRSFLAGRDTKE